MQARAFQWCALHKVDALSYISLLCEIAARMPRTKGENTLSDHPWRYSKVKSSDEKEKIAILAGLT
jgi:hypothetical protein